MRAEAGAPVEAVLARGGGRGGRRLLLEGDSLLGAVAGAELRPVHAAELRALVLRRHVFHGAELQLTRLLLFLRVLLVLLVLVVFLDALIHQ